MMQFVRGLWRQPWYVLFWVGLLAILNGVAPLFFLPAKEAVATLAVFLVGVLAMIAIAVAVGFKRILGAGHFLWFPLLAYLLARITAHSASTQMGLWLRLVIAANAVSLVIDVVDVVRYVRGDRAEL